MTMRSNTFEFKVHTLHSSVHKKQWLLQRRRITVIGKLKICSFVNILAAIYLYVHALAWLSGPRGDREVIRPSSRRGVRLRTLPLTGRLCLPLASPGETLIQ